MEPDLEYGKSSVGTQVRSADRQKVLSAEEGHPLQVAEPGENNHALYRMNPAESLGATPEVQRSQFQSKSLRWKPSPTVWRLALMIGDGIILIALLVRVMNPAPHLGSIDSDTIFGIWNAKLIWLFLALASWSLAVSLTQAQQLDCAASLLKSPLYALCSLAPMLIFYMLLLYLFIGGEVIHYIRSLLLFLLITTPVVCIWRVILADVMNAPRFRRQAVIVGVNAAGESLAREFLRARHPGVNVLGFISENIIEEGQQQQDGLAVFGGRSALHNLAQNGAIDMIIMAIDFKSNPGLFQEALEGAQRGISVIPVARAYESISGKIPLDHIGDQWSSALPLEQFVSPLYLCWNRVLDLAFGICGLVLLCILLPVLAPLIYLDSPGPIFFSQQRAGYRGRTFRILKFRSMSTASNRGDSGAWTTKGDVRLTRIGRCMRAIHLDELPQVINIIRSDMSLIGPRPERPEYIAELAQCNPFYSSRLSVRPGLTGWAQVKYGYGNSEQDELVKLQYDLYYIKHQSFLLDVCILVKTVGEVVLLHGV